MQPVTKWPLWEGRSIMYSVHSSQNHRQTIISHCKHFLDAWVSVLNLTFNALCGQWWKSARADNQWEVDWELKQECIGGNEAGVGAKATGSSHTALLPKVQKGLSCLLFCSSRLPYQGKEIIWGLLPCIVLLFPLVRGGCISQQQ